MQRLGRQIAIYNGIIIGASVISAGLLVYGITIHLSILSAGCLTGVVVLMRWCKWAAGEARHYHRMQIDLMASLINMKN